MDSYPISKSIVKLKNEFIKIHKARSNIYEVIPSLYSVQLPIDEETLSRLNDFAECNSIYFKSTEVRLVGIPCRVYEGDINNYWLSGKKYDTNYQPFYPTWMMSAYALALEAKSLGFEQLVDVGAGDGRVAYCASLLRMGPYAIEIDDDLVQVQDAISSVTGINFKV